MATLAVAVAFTTGLLAGCSSMSTSPLPVLSGRADLPAGASLQGAERRVMPGDPPAEGPVVGGIPAPPPPPAASGLTPTAILAPYSPGGTAAAALSFKSASVVNGGKASVYNGRWTIDVPKDAVPGDAQVSLGIPASKSTGCEVDVSPAAASPFTAPATLTVDLHGVAGAKGAKYVIRRYNPATNAWEVVPGSVADKRGKWASAPITQAGLYSAGL